MKKYYKLVDLNDNKILDVQAMNEFDFKVLKDALQADIQAKKVAFIEIDKVEYNSLTSQKENE